MNEPIYYTKEQLEGAERALRLLYDAFNEAAINHSIKLPEYLDVIFHRHKNKIDYLIANYKPEPQY